MTKREALHIAVSAGEILLKSGAEIFRVTETIERIMNAFGVEDHDVYILANAIFVNVDEMGEERCFAIRSVPTASINLARIAAVNELSRSIALNPRQTNYKGYLSRLKRCAELPLYPWWLRMLASGVGAGAFCCLMGAGAWDGVASFVCGIALQVFFRFYGHNKLSPFMPTILGAALTSSLGILIGVLFPALSLDFIIIGSILPLVPGVSLTTSIRDFFGGNFLSGTIYMIDALLTGVCIAVGVGVSLQAWSMILEVAS